MTPTKAVFVLLPVALIVGLIIAQRGSRSEPPPAAGPVATEAAIAEPIADAPTADAPLSGAAVKDGIDVATGLVAEGDYMIVRATCTVCHSSKLVLQNRATRDGWERMIRWMQDTQKLWDLGENEDKILDYLATYYAPVEQGRRPPLVIADHEWYEISQGGAVGSQGGTLGW